MNTDLLPRRVAAKVVVSDSGCWLWTGSKTHNGYASAKVEGDRVRVHRYAYERAFGPIPVGLVVDHLCFTRECINPDHLEVVTQAENLRRSRERYGLRVTCSHGHPYDSVNTRYESDGRRTCRICDRDRRRAYVAAKTTSGGVKAPYDLPAQSTAHATVAAPPLGT